LQRHYGILEALADEMPDIKDETLPDEEGMSRYLLLFSLFEHAKLQASFPCKYKFLNNYWKSWYGLHSNKQRYTCYLIYANSYRRSGVVKAIEEFKASVYGENYDQEAEAAAAKGSRGVASKKRKAITDAACQKCAAYDWAELADNGR
jgi:ATP-dependent DNA helicase 2 subunit 1